MFAECRRQIEQTDSFTPHDRSLRRHDPDQVHKSAGGELIKPADAAVFRVTALLQMQPAESQRPSGAPLGKAESDPGLPLRQPNAISCLAAAILWPASRSGILRNLWKIGFDLIFVSGSLFPNGNKSGSERLKPFNIPVQE
jgi:hypothetical protein